MSAVTPFQGGSSLPTRPLRAAVLAFVGALAVVEVGAGLVVGQAWRLQGAQELTPAERGDLRTLFDRLAGLETAVVVGALATTLVWSLIVAHNALFAARTSRTVAATTAVGWVTGPLLFLVARVAIADTGTAGAVALAAQCAALYVPFWATGRLADTIGGQRMPFMRWYLALAASFLVHEVITAKIDLDPLSTYDDFGKGAFMLFLNAMVVGVMGVMAAEATSSVVRAVGERAAQHRMLVEDAHQRRRAHGPHTGDAPVLPSPRLHATDGPRLPAPAPGSVKVAAAPVLAAVPVAVLAPPTVTPPATSLAAPTSTPSVAHTTPPAAFGAPTAAPAPTSAPTPTVTALAPPAAGPAPDVTAAPAAATLVGGSGLPTLAASPFASASCAPVEAPELSLGDLVERTPATEDVQDELLVSHRSLDAVPVVAPAPVAADPFAAPPSPVLVQVAEAVAEVMLDVAVDAAPNAAPAEAVVEPVASSGTFTVVELVADDQHDAAFDAAPVVFESPESPIAALVRSASSRPAFDLPVDGSLYPPLASLTAMRQVVDSDRAVAAEAAARAEEEARLAEEAARLAEEEKAREGLPELFAPLTPLGALTPLAPRPN